MGMVNNKKYSASVDVWGLGVLLYEFLVGQPPFMEDDESATYKKIASGELRFPPQLTREATDLISRLLHKDPRQRIALSQVLQHPWVALNCRGASGRKLQERYGGPDPL